MPNITFTQYLRPNGRKTTIDIDRPEEIAKKAQELVAAGCRLEAEVLMNGICSFTVERGDEEFFGHKLCDNGPEVLTNIDKLITEAYEEVINGKSTPAPES